MPTYFSADHVFFLMGSSAGMGRAIAHRLVQQGASVMLAARNERDLLKVQDECLDLRSNEKQRVRITQMDLLDPESPARLARSLSGETLSGILVNGGGPHGENPLALTRSEMDHAHNLLFAGPVLHLQAALASLSDGGAIVALTSTTVKEPHSSLTLSGSYRSALTSHLKNLSMLLGPRGISVTSIAPGFIETDRLSDLREFEALRLGKSTEDINRSWASCAALNRIGQTDEIANLACFLFSSQCRFLTGQTLVADGGQVRGV